VIRGPIQYGERAAVMHVSCQHTRGEPERRTRATIATALDIARSYTLERPGFKVHLVWAWGEVYVRAGRVYLSYSRGSGRREWSVA